MLSIINSLLLSHHLSVSQKYTVSLVVSFFETSTRLPKKEQKI